MGTPSTPSIVGFGVRRGRRPGAIAAGWFWSRRDCTPRHEQAKPSEGTTAVKSALSLGVAEKMLPSASAAAQYVVSRARVSAIWADTLTPTFSAGSSEPSYLQDR